MNVGTFAVLVVVVIIVVLALRSVLKKKGGCGCSSGGSCEGCSGCSTKVYGINAGPGIDEPKQCPHCKQ